MAKPGTGRDAGAKRRAYAGPALFSFGFRPFFLGGALFAGLAVPVWMAAFAHGYVIGPDGDALGWHAHEMIFGFLAAIIGGFLLTAIPNWTGRAPVMGGPLMLMFGLWLLGRAVMLTAEPGLVGRSVDSLFLVVLSAAAWREVIAGRNWRNLPVCLLLSLFALANILWHLAALDLVALQPRAGQRVALAAAIMLMSLIGGRLVPSFTNNWMKQRRIAAMPVPFNRFDKLVLAATGAAMILWIALPLSVATGGLLALTGVLQTMRLLRWKGWQTTKEPLVLILHVGYGWIAAAILLLAADILLPGRFSGSSALHALTAGAVGQLTLAVMTRASLGHTGRPLTAGRATVAIYALVFIGAALRVLLPATPIDYSLGVSIAGIVWASGFLLFAAVYGPWLSARRAFIPDASA